MSWLTWVTNLSFVPKFFLGLGVGIVAYALFRYSIYKLNKYSKENGLAKRKHQRDLSDSDRLNNLLSLGRD